MGLNLSPSLTNIQLRLMVGPPCRVQRNNLVNSCHRTHAGLESSSWNIRSWQHGAAHTFRCWCVGTAEEYSSYCCENLRTDWEKEEGQRNRGLEREGKVVLWGWEGGELLVRGWVPEEER